MRENNGGCPCGCIVLILAVLTLFFVCDSLNKAERKLEDIQQKVTSETK